VLARGSLRVHRVVALRIPASDAACTKGWDTLKSEVGIEPHNLLEATPRNLASAVKPGGMVPKLRALRLKEIACPH
jgi:hypothetical protein